MSDPMVHLGGVGCRILLPFVNLNGNFMLIACMIYFCMVLPCCNRIISTSIVTVNYIVYLVNFQTLLLNEVHSHLYVQLRQRRYYEKPTKKRERLEYEKCHRLYNREMKSKVEFVMKQHPPLPSIW